MKLPPHLQAQRAADLNRRERFFRKFTPGSTFEFRPAKAQHERTGQLVTIIRPPRNDVQHPTIRVQFPDGTQLTVPPSQLHNPPKPAPTPAPKPTPDPPLVTDARNRPSWPRILNLIDELHEADTDHAARHHLPPEDLQERPLTPREPLETNIAHRVAQLAGMIAPPGTTRTDKTALATTLRHYANLDAATRRAARPGRNTPHLVTQARQHPNWQTVITTLNTHPHTNPLPALTRIARHLTPHADPDDHVRAAHQLTPYAQQDARRHASRPARSTQPPGAPSLTPDDLEQHARHLHNAIARSIHLRYFLSDANPRPDQHRVNGSVRRAIRDAGRSEGLSTEQPAPRNPRPSELHRQAADAYQAATHTSLEICNLLLTGQTEQAHVLLETHRRHRHEYQTATQAIAALRPQLHTGRYFHGDILSVRDEHLDRNEQGEVIAYHGMTQYYTRLTITYADNGHNLTIANATELQTHTGIHTDPRAWTDLCRWIQDTSDRHAGKGQGRRQDDDDHLIHRTHEGRLILRPTIQSNYPHLLQALEAIRLSLPAQLNDVHDTEIPDRHPARGYHPPKPQEDGGDLTKHRPKQPNSH
ncbi:hypothetical protein [Deinococcus sp. 6GRE01]|uniref:hypothetical protein n=1 Tax=Deinococcus sp. 6GRE01 TaxID=2745873 RepID=UPI001E506F02|nr:hypothetical protein [Deinococcus sp. 6GRE01]MCD0156272.1 hypothetical protein [Deinococcus sp. 6GRE01]